VIVGALKQSEKDHLQCDSLIPNGRRVMDELEKSVEHNGEKPMTNKWMLNILKKAQSNLYS